MHMYSENEKNVFQSFECISAGDTDTPPLPTDVYSRRLSDGVAPGAGRRLRHTGVSLRYV